MEAPETRQVLVSKGARVTGWVLGILPAGLLMFSASGKFFGMPGLAEGYAHLGWSVDAAVAMGILETTCAVLYLLPRTAVLGAILMTGYMGGAIATHTRIGEEAVLQVLVGVFAWLGLYLRDPRVRVLAPWRMPAGWIADGRKHVLRKVAIIVAVVVCGLLIMTGLMPNTLNISRSLEMNAPATAVWEQVDDFHKWGAWDPFARKDPACKTTFTGAQRGVGSTMSWAGNSDVGEGSATIVDSVPGDHVKIRLDFKKPMQATDMVEFVFKETGGKTLTTWSMSGKQKFLDKGVCMLLHMKGMLEGEFDKGLKDLKAAAEKK